MINYLKWFLIRCLSSISLSFLWYNSIITILCSSSKCAYINLNPEFTPLPFKVRQAIFFTLITHVVIPRSLILKLNGGLSLGSTFKTLFTVSRSSFNVLYFFSNCFKSFLNSSSSSKVMALQFRYRNFLQKKEAHDKMPIHNLLFHLL